MIENDPGSTLVTDALGERVGPDTIRFERRFDASPERVWQALTTPEGLETWLGGATIDLRPGGSFRVQLTPNVTMDGRIRHLEPPAKLTLAWRELEDGALTHHAVTETGESELSFELRADGDGTRLTLVHRLIRAGEPMIGFGAGWHAFLQKLRTSLASSASLDVMEYYERVRPAYVRAFER